MEPVTGLTVGSLKSFPYICSDDREFSKIILNRYRNISKNPGFIGQVLNKKKTLKFGILDLEYLALYPWVITEERIFNYKEFIFCPVSFETKILVENSCLPKKGSEIPSIKQPPQKGVFQYQIPIFTIGTENGFLETCYGMSGILNKKSILSFIFQMSITSGSFRKYLLSKPFSLMNYLNVKSGNTEMPVSIPFFFRSRNYKDKSLDQKNDKTLFEHNNTYYKQSTIFHESGINNYEEDTSFIGHLLSFSHDKNINELKNGFDGYNRSRFSPDTFLDLNKWVVATIDRVRISHYGSVIPRGQKFNREENFDPKFELKKGELLNKVPFAEDLKYDDPKQSFSLLFQYSDLQSSHSFQYNSNNSTKTSIKHKVTGLLDREKRPQPEIRMKEDHSMDKITIMDDISSEVQKQKEYASFIPLTSISNQFSPDNYPYKGEKTEIDLHSIILLKKERERSVRVNILNEYKKAGQISRTTINLISDLFAINHRILNKSISGFLREPMNVGIVKFDERLSYHLISRSGSLTNRIHINPVHGSNRVIKSGNHTIEIPMGFGGMPLTSSILPFEDRKSNQQSRFELIEQEEEDFIARTQRTHPVQMKLKHMKENIPREISKNKKDVVEEERYSSLTSQSTNLMPFDMHHLTDQVYQMLEKKIQIERERRGM